MCLQVVPVTWALSLQVSVYMIAVTGNSNFLYSERGQNIKAITKGDLVPVSRVKIQRAHSSRNSDRMVIGYLG